jgi:HEPN domain-containing protein
MKLCSMKCLRPSVSDEIIGFHCQQAAEKILKALLSDVGVRFRKTHEIGALMALLTQAGHVLPDRFENLDVLTPFGAIYRYEDYEAAVSLDRAVARASVRELRAWVETKLRERTNQ